MSRVLVTGGAGFIGSHLVDHLISQKHNVLVVDDLSVGLKKNVNDRARLIKIKVQDKQLSTVFLRFRPNYVFHLAAQKNLQYSLQNPLEDALTNIIGSLRVIDSAKKAKVNKIIFFSSAAVYNIHSKPPNTEKEHLAPVTPYGFSKRTTEDYIINSGLNYSIIRPSNVYGPRQDAGGEGGVVAIFCKNLAQKKPSQINNDGRQTRDFIYVSDVVKASILAMQIKQSDIYNISTSLETSINNLFLRLKRIANSNIKAIYGKKLNEQTRSALANKHAINNLNWRPIINIDNGLVSTLDWFSENYGKKTVY